MTRLTHDRFYLVSAAGARRRDHELLRQTSDDIVVNDLTEQRGILALAGPKARNVLATLTDADLSNAAFPWLSAQEIEIAGISVLALRVSYVGELGWELHHSIADQAALYGALMTAGESHGIRPCGIYALNAMRLEKGYRAWGLDIGTEKTPLEAGLQPFVKMEGRDFLGKNALTEPAWRMVLLELEATNVDAFGLHPVFVDGALVGLTTSGAYGHRVQKSLALAYIKRNVDLEEMLTVNLLTKPVPARVLHRVPYDPTNARMRA